VYLSGIPASQPAGRHWAGKNNEKEWEHKMALELLGMLSTCNKGKKTWGRGFPQKKDHKV